jgi:predicted nucleic acid-binding protein
MAVMISLDSSVLIDFFRLRDKKRSLYQMLHKEHNEFAISAIAKYEVVIGAKRDELDTWADEFKNMTFLETNDDVVLAAREIYMQLKRDNKLIEARDIIIAATAIVYRMPLATLNHNHFSRIDGLDIITLN